MPVFVMNLTSPCCATNVLCFVLINSVLFSPFLYLNQSQHLLQLDLATSKAVCKPAMTAAADWINATDNEKELCFITKMGCLSNRTDTEHF